MSTLLLVAVETLGGVGAGGSSGRMFVPGFILAFVYVSTIT